VIGGLNVLQIDDLSVSYGPTQAVRGVSLTVQSGEVIGLIGPNGAGKTSILLAISGLASSRGKIRFEDTLLNNLPAPARAQLGIGHVPQGRRVFADLSVRDNLLAGTGKGVSRTERDRRLSDVFDIFPRLADRRRQRAGQMSGGEQQMLAIGRALMGEPKLLLLDEPTLGLAPVLVDTLLEHVRWLHQSKGLAVLLVDQRVLETLEFCDRAYVLEQGRITGGGRTAELLQSSEIKASYLGL
jgi:branched-chain amino acid transport system ATP-binding protein